MSTRRVPLSSNPNVANSPLRVASTALNGVKKTRSHAESLREEPYGQPPPAKRQMIERGVASPGSRRHAADRGAAVSPAKRASAARAVVPSPSRTKTTTRTIVHRSASRAVGATATAATQRTSHAAAAQYKHTTEEMVNLRTWHTQIRSRFPKMVFYFESVTAEQQSKLAKLVGKLGGREEKFFSIDITHVVTTRPIPPEKKDDHDDGADAQENEQPRTIDPALLNRTADPTRRKLVFDTSRKQKPRSSDVLHRARDMGKKIWSLEKLNKILDIALASDPCQTGSVASGRGGSQAPAKTGKNLAILLENERVHGPSDRDPTVSNQDMYNFRGPYIYIYDIEEKTKPVMIREYPKANEPKDGDWPQFRISSQGRCPFVMDDNYDAPEKETRDRDRERARAKARVAAKAAAAAAAADEAVEQAPPMPKEAEIPPPKAVPEKRTLSQMEDGHNRGAAPEKATASFDRSKVSNPPSLDFRSQNAFISHAKAGRFLAGEPVASGLQPSNVTSAIRSQMISSTTGGVLGAKAGTSKEIHGLQRKVVLQKATAPALSQDLSSRRMAEMSHDSNVFGRSASFSHATNRKLDAVDEEEASRQREKLRRTASVPVSQPKPKRDPKPGYCENCQDKFEDFEDHIVSRKHRKFAENDDNWSQLDALLSQLKRVPRY